MATVTLEPALSESELSTLRAGMRRYTEQHVAWEGYKELAAVLKDDTGGLQGAAIGEAGRGWLHISVIWVHEDFRSQGHGRRLLQTLESEALKHDCHHAYLDTFSYQAKPFYERNGYRVFGQLDDYPQGHTRYFMSKQIG